MLSKIVIYCKETLERNQTNFSSASILFFGESQLQSFESDIFYSRSRVRGSCNKQ